MEFSLINLTKVLSHLTPELKDLNYEITSRDNLKITLTYVKNKNIDEECIKCRCRCK